VQATTRSEDVCREAALSLPGLSCVCLRVLDFQPDEQHIDQLLGCLAPFVEHCARLQEARLLFWCAGPERVATWHAALLAHERVRRWTARIRLVVDRGNFPYWFIEP